MASANLIQISVAGGIQNTLAAQGDGLILPKISSAVRNALSLTSSDIGLTVYNTTIQSLCIWTVSGWSIIAPPAVATIYTGVVDPEGIVTAVPGSIYFNIAIPSSPVQFVKGSGTGNTGWV